MKGAICEILIETVFIITIIILCSCLELYKLQNLNWVKCSPNCT